jgi:hypothetical protein
MKIPVMSIAPGQTVSYRGEPCIVLEHRESGTLLLALNAITYEFGSDNNFAASTLRMHLNNSYLEKLTEHHPDEIITRTVDLTALNGSKQYGTCECKVAPLTVDELRKYHDILRKTEQHGWEWSATPWSTPQVNEDDTWVTGLNANGNFYSIRCSLTYGSRPAFLIPSNFAVSDDEDAEDTEDLSQYTDDELLEELHRRLSGQDA